tara:strand:- start:21 stop:809 length:789 start_codon:yes stop_codon:yes gene_type:complete
MRNKKNIINRSLIVFIICSFFSVIIFFSSDINEFKHFRIHFSKFFSLIFSPKQALNDLSLLQIKNNELINEIKKISQENLNLNQRIRTINTHRDYDKKLNKLIPNHRFIPAKVLSHSLSKSINIFNVNVGIKDGISNDYKAVINYDGNLVGKTWTVTDSQTQVHKISDRNFNVYVRTDNNVFGQFSYKSGRLGIVESISKSNESLLNVGDIFYTTQSSSIYPENIPVAKIIDIKNRRNEHELYIKVEILADLSGLRNVFIIE